MKKILLILCLFLLVGCGKAANKVYSLTLNNKTFYLGEEYTKEKYGESIGYSEVSSCSFEGLDKTYKYDHYEVTTYPVDGKDKVYLIYFLDDEISTTEGLKLSDSYNDMISKYGEKYKKEGNLYTYTLGKTNLNIIVENGFVTSIEYTHEV